MCDLGILLLVSGGEKELQVLQIFSSNEIGQCHAYHHLDLLLRFVFGQVIIAKKRKNLTQNKNYGRLVIQPNAWCKHCKGRKNCFFKCWICMLRAGKAIGGLNRTGDTLPNQ